MPWEQRYLKITTNDLLKIQSDSLDNLLVTSLKRLPTQELTRHCSDLTTSTLSKVSKRRATGLSNQGVHFSKIDLFRNVRVFIGL